MKISEVTRRAIFDALTVEGESWSGRLEETQFLGRLYNLSSIRSTDGRFSDAESDIWQHRVNNFDWDEHWVFYDGRFGLPHGDDQLFLRQKRVERELLHLRVRLLLSLGYSYKQIERMMGVPKSTVRNISKKMREDGGELLSPDSPLKTQEDFLIKQMLDEMGLNRLDHAVTA